MGHAQPDKDMFHRAVYGEALANGKEVDDELWFVR